MSSKVFWCSSCLTMSTRPRITFDHRGRCNACVWVETKAHIKWDERQADLEELLRENKSNDGSFDCVVPVSGGKDGSYVAYNLKHKFGMNPLAVTINPPLPTDLGRKNLENFIQSGFAHIAVTPDPEAMRTLNKHGFIEKGFPYFGWLTAITLAPLEVASRFDVDLVFYGEDGEVEYGGASQTETTPYRDMEYLNKIYLEDGHDQVLTASGLSASSLRFFSFPESLSSRETTLKRLNWSYFENWDPYRNYLVAKEHCGLEDAESSNHGTFTNFSQNDQFLYALHTYMMYLKFGFGRANQDACIEIRRGAMSRDKGIELVRLYDGQYPEELEGTYLDYFGMSQEEFFDVLRKWANPRLFEETSQGVWQAKFAVA